MDKMILIDLETQDFSVTSGIYEVACLAVENYEIVDKLYLGNQIPNYKGKKGYGYGFYNISEDIKCMKIFQDFLITYPYPIVAHNCPFDRKFLVYYQWINEDYPAYCTLQALKNSNQQLASYSLQNLVKHYGIAEEVEHNAMSDIENVYKILKLVKPETWIPVGGRSRYKKYSKTKARALEDIDLDIATTNILDGEVVCFTGDSDYPRHTMQEIAIKNGAVISNSITRKTTMLVVGRKAGSKLDKAHEKGIPIIMVDEFMKTLHLNDKEIIA